MENIAELTHIPFEELTNALSEFTLKREPGDIGGVSTKNFMGKNAANEFMNFLLSTLKSNLTQSQKVETLNQLGISGENVSRFVPLMPRATEYWNTLQNDTSKYRKRGFNQYNKDYVNLDNNIIKAKLAGEDSQFANKHKAILDYENQQAAIKRAYREGEQSQQDIINNFGTAAKVLAEGATTWKNNIDNIVNTVGGSRTPAENLRDNIAKRQTSGAPPVGGRW